MTRTPLDEALDVLEWMAIQYLTDATQAPLDAPILHHAFMGAGQDTCELLCRLRPDRWAETSDGARYIGPKDAL